MSSPPWFDPSPGQRLGIVEAAPAPPPLRVASAEFQTTLTNSAIRDTIFVPFVVFPDTTQDIFDLSNPLNPEILAPALLTVFVTYNFQIADMAAGKAMYCEIDFGNRPTIQDNISLDPGSAIGGGSEFSQTLTGYLAPNLGGVTVDFDHNLDAPLSSVLIQVFATALWL